MMKYMMLIGFFLLSTTTARADWETTPPLTGQWAGSFRCVAQNASAAPLTIWIEIIEADNSGTVESARACLDVAPGGTCERSTEDQRGRRCQVQWNGPPDAVMAVGYGSSDTTAKRMEAHRQAMRRKAQEAERVKRTGG